MLLREILCWPRLGPEGLTDSHSWISSFVLWRRQETSIKVFSFSRLSTGVRETAGALVVTFSKHKCMKSCALQWSRTSLTENILMYITSVMSMLCCEVQHCNSLISVSITSSKLHSLDSLSVKCIKDIVNTGMGNSGEEGWGCDLCIVLSHTTRKHVKLMEASLTSVLTIETLKPVKKRKTTSW